MFLRRFLELGRTRVLWVSYSVLLVTTAVVGGLGGLIFGYAVDFPEVERLQTDRPNIVSYVYATDGRTVGQFALEKRYLVPYEKIPQRLKEAILSIEDASFFDHSGIDFRRLFITVFRDIFFGERKGASTLTMQLSKLLFTSSEKTVERKIKDMLFALKIEKNYSKEQIFTFYCNQIYMGHGTYGIASAADFYFNKHLEQLTLDECAMLAGIIQVPERHSPINRPSRALGRRNLVMRRMHEEGFIDSNTLQQATSQPLLARGKNYDRSPAPYFVEWTRQYLERNYETNEIWEGGLKIHTTLDYDMQVAAHQALTEGLKKFDKEKRAWTKPEENILKQGKNLETYFHPEWRQMFYEGQMVHGLVLESSAKQALVKIGSYTAHLEKKDVVWTKKTRLDQILTSGDVAVFLIHQIDRTEKTIKATLDRIPEVQGALLVIENTTGAIKAMVGGFDFRYSKFNRSTQALRQPGSIFKAFTYVAATEAGYAPSDKILDAPVSFRDGLGRIYAPENSDKKFKGLIPLQDALSQSRNVPTIRLANALGIPLIIQVAQRFGINREFPPYLPMALGAGELTLKEITSAFSVFPNKGVRALPYFVERVEDYNGVTREEHQQRFEQVISADTAEKMVYLLRNVIREGTARRARSINRPAAGKTGTTNDSTDSWFVGFIPQITVGIWAGHDEKKSLGEKVYGSNLALPIWIDYIKNISSKLSVKNFESTFITQDLNAPKRAQSSKKKTAENPWSVEDIPPPDTALRPQE